jgi:alpha-ketoglutarate-dependent taurine dioxygenase
MIAISPDPGGRAMALAAAASSQPSDAYRIRTMDDRDLPLVVEPNGNANVVDLATWLRSRRDWVREMMTHHGAVLFRGFDVTGASDFERIARAIDDDLKNEYLGTSPRNALTDYVFSASELPGFYPIPQHCEMSFTAHPPTRLFFSCFVEPAAGSGETPLVDFRRVYRDLDPAVRQRFERGGVRIVRNYSGPAEAGKKDLWKLKRWDEMFLTTDRTAVEAKCREEGFTPVWGERDRLRLISTQPATRMHPTTGEVVWHNHSQVFHLSAGPGEYRRIYELRPSLKYWLLWRFAGLMVALQRRTRSSDEQSMHCTYLDGAEISDADMEAVRAAIWRNLVITPWHRGDVVAIDNYAVAHGRLPYTGPREIAVCWA